MLQKTTSTPVGELSGRKLGFLLPASPALRGLAFEKLARFALASAGIARPLTGAFGVNLGRPGQWDGLVSGNGTFILDAKAYLGKVTTIPKLERRLEEAAVAGLAGVMVVLLRHSVIKPVAPAKGMVSVHFLPALVPEPEMGQAMLPTGDVLRFEKWGATCGTGRIDFDQLPIAGRYPPATLIEDGHLAALVRAAMMARAGNTVRLADVPPFGSIGGEAATLWTCEDCLRGLYAPPLAVLQRVLGGQGCLSLDDLPDRLRRNLGKILTNCGRLPLPQTREEARARVSAYPPFRYWAHLRRGVDFAQAVSRISDAYAAYRGYADNLFNANKSRACERYLFAAGVHISEQ
ncbi:MAG: hypothetical protein WC712_04830 [Candidatus Brocadiia bacterium]